jgi:hypothetical protein
MRIKNLFVMSFLALALGIWVQGKKGPKGEGGGKPSNNTYAAKFVIHDFYSDAQGTMYSTDLSSDSGGSYVDGVNDVNAEFVGSGNPLLKLGNSNTRFAEVDLTNCAAVEGDEYNDTVLLLNQGPVRILGISPYGMSVDGNFLGMSSDLNGSDHIADTLLGIGLENLPDDDRGWSIRFDPAFASANMATVERVSEVEWAVDTLSCTDDCKAAIVRPALKKGKQSKLVVATCEPFNIKYTVTCDLDQDGLCDPK